MSSLRAKYEAFLVNPTTGALAENASINYIPTLTTINEPTAILKHFAAQKKLLTKKSERVLSAIESSDGLCVDVETTIEFVAGGGAILPGLDDNFLADKIHIVQFEPDQKIRQIRQYWDQGSLLKQVDVIGSRARNWPIRDGKDQVRLIANSATSEQLQSASFSRRSTTSNHETASSARSRGSTTSATGDPHATLSLFQPRDVNDGMVERTNGPGVAPRTSAKPPSRDLSDILSGTEVEAPSTPGSSIRSPSPRKANGGAPKGGAGTHYHPIRLFDENDASATQKSPEKSMADAKRYNHFEFGEGEDAGSLLKQHVNNRHQSQWEFADFVTPEKTRMKLRPNDQRTMAWAEGEEEGQKSPQFRPIVHQARPDAETHFEFVDDGTPVADKPKFRAHKDGMGLYKDNVVETGNEDTVKKPLSTLVHVNQEHRHKDFDSHYEFTDLSPSTTRTTNPNNGKVNENTAKVLKGMDSNWDTYDESPNASSKKENVPARGIKTGGDGMGGRKDSSRHWGFGDDSDPESTSKTTSQQHKRTGSSKKTEEVKSFWDF